MSRPILAVIAAVARNGGIGHAGGLVWQESEDQKHFRRVTMGCPVIMGRKTWDSLPDRFRPLPGRRNVVVTHQPDWQAAGAEPAPSLDEALRRCREAPLVFVIGGAQLYALALPRADELVLTEIDADLPADVHFPDWPRDEFRLVSSEPRVSADGTAYRFNRYERRRGR
ncbi:MAG: dihydrofolate reductase [Piscinibacter sp.]|nr:dihydrofolate reductase [Piscinibacter sp.]